MKPGKVALFGVPSAAGGRAEGPARAPEALRAQGLRAVLESAGLTVTTLPDTKPFPYREDGDHPRARNAAGVADAARAAADQMAMAVREGFALAIGGDCTMVLGTSVGVRRALDQPTGLVFLDADADLNTPETTPSGYLHGMALALALGRGPSDVVAAAGPPPAVLPDHVSLLGFRALDEGERTALGDLGLALPASAARRIGMRTSAALALDGVGNHDGPILVHLDVDIVDPEEMAAKDPLTPGPGLTWDETSDLLTALLASPRVVALEVAEFNPDRDPDGACGRRLVEVLARAVARRLRA